MKAGRELDALVAEKIFGWERRNESWYDEEGVEGTILESPGGVMVHAHGWGSNCNYDELGDGLLPNYSTVIEDAWTVVERIKAVRPDHVFQMTWHPEQRWQASFRFPYSGFGLTAPHAICLAALEAVGVKVTP